MMPVHAVREHKLLSVLRKGPHRIGTDAACGTILGWLGGQHTEVLLGGELTCPDCIQKLGSPNVVARRLEPATARELALRALGSEG